MHKPAQDLRLGLWRAHILYEASLRPVWGGMLLRLLAERGHHVPLSIAHDCLAFMTKKGWLARVGPRRHNQVNLMRLTRAGHARLQRLRREIGETHRLIMGHGRDADSRSLESTLREILQSNQAEAARLRDALIQVQSMLAAIPG